MTRMQRSWALAKSSWAVLKSEKGLAWFPVLSFLASLLIAGIFALAVWATLGKDTGLNGQDQYSTNIATWVLAVCAYVGVAFVQTYFMAALCAGANERLQGRDTTMSTALAVANSRLHRILPWAILSATVSMIIQAIEERFGFLGQIIAGLIGAAWNVVTFLTVPIIVFEDLGPVNALKRSGHLLKQTWGENLAAQIGLGLIGLLAFIPGVIVIGLGIASGVAVVTVLTVAIGAVYLAIAASVVAALSGIYRTALYRYAVDGRVPEAFADTDMEHAFGARRNLRGGFGGNSTFGGNSGFAGPSNN
jgi:Family of unknown function (DUF6159)